MTHSRGELLHGLSKKLIHLSGNDLINKRLSGKGNGGIFNVCDEIPQFVLNRLMAGKKFKIIGMQEVEDYLQDENSPKFSQAWEHHLYEKKLSEESLEEEEIREMKDGLRVTLGMRPAHELIPAKHMLELPRQRLQGTEEEKHLDDKLQTDLSEDKLKKCLEKIERERVRFEREKGLQTLYAAFGFLKWTNSEGKDFTSPILLLKVTLEKNQGAYKLAASGDLETNQNLSYALFQETKSRIPDAADFLDENGNCDITTLFEAYESFIEKYESWKILNRISVGIFKSRGIPFSEILPEGYSEESVDRTEEMLVGRDQSAESGGDRDVDHVDMRELVPSFALNADSSQHAAILEVAEGKDLVIEGPPGTGKSQTIVNLISNALYHNKSVLFLAQKLAALEVVNHRLKNIGLGKKCLSLHSEYTNKSTLFASFEEKIQAPLPHEKVSLDQFNRVRKERDDYLTKLNNHAHKLSKCIFDKRDTSLMDKDQLIAHHALTTYTLLKDTIEHQESPNFQVSEGYDLRELNQDLQHAERLEGMVEGIDRDNIRVLAVCSLSKVPNPFEAQEIQEEVVLHSKAMEAFPDDYLEANLESLRQLQDQISISLDKRILYEKTEEQIGICIKDKERPFPEVVFKMQKQMGSPDSWYSPIIASIFPWTGSAKSKRYFKELVGIAKAPYKEIYDRAKDIVDVLKKNEDAKKHLSESGYLETKSDGIKGQVEWLEARINELQKAADFAQKISCRFNDPKASLLIDIFQLINRAKGSFRDLCEINQVLGEFDQRIRSGEWLRYLILENQPVAKSLEAHLYRYFSKKVAEDSPEIFSVDRKEMDRLRKQFKKAEEECRETYIQHIASRMPNSTDVPRIRAARVREKTGLALIEHVAKTPGARVTVRELCTRAVDALQHYTPCFLMTPSSVADYLPKQTEFDLVIIDEASQMLPEEAIGSILRSKQIVVVGDPKQMPPTRYMQSTLQDEVDDEDETKYSILDKAMLAFPNFRRLCYHYRSEDESLIRFSNNEFYENDLMTVPNLKDDEQYGVKFIDAKGVYNTGNADWVSVDGSGQMAGWSPSKNPNPIEAEKLAEIIDHEIRERPEWSIGVAVMNLKQAIRVEELFQEKIDDTIRGYLNRWRNTPEYFFIKNLENVQGDERDTIIISTVYGKNHEGRMFQRYGPINMDKGENRINVLVTRAKKRVVVCSSMDPNDISAPNDGPQVLRRYLQYAKTGHIEDNSTRNEPDSNHWYDSPWEKWFHDRLEADGYIVNPQVGVSGWRIDLGIMHKDFPDGYLCGVELDGKDHLRQSARDRDIERQAILESKGWIILRVWSIDFFDDMEGEYQLLKSSIDEILESKIKVKPSGTEQLEHKTFQEADDPNSDNNKHALLDY